MDITELSDIIAKWMKEWVDTRPIRKKIGNGYINKESNLNEVSKIQKKN